jgi:hypothetical protein
MDNLLILKGVFDWLRSVSIWPNLSGDFRAFPGYAGDLRESLRRRIRLKARIVRQPAGQT